MNKEGKNQLYYIAIAIICILSIVLMLKNDTISPLIYILALFSLEQVIINDNLNINIAIMLLFIFICILSFIMEFYLFIDIAIILSKYGEKRSSELLILKALLCSIYFITICIKIQSIEDIIKEDLSTKG